VTTRLRPMLDVEIVTDSARAVELSPAWDALAVACRRPYCAPAWMLAWWRYHSTDERLLRIVAVHENDELVGLGPFFVDHTERGAVRWRLLGSQTSSRIEPVARPGSETAVGAALASAIAIADPRPDVVTFEGTVDTSLWPDLLSQRWPGRVRPLRQVEMSMPAPTLTFGDRNYHEWFASRSPNFREIKRRGRRLVEQGGFFRVARTEEEARAGIAAFAELHHSRWEARGGSGVLDDRVERMVSDAAAAMVEDLRMRLWTIEVEGRIIAAELFLAAGGEVSNWLGGFDEAWSKYGPSLLLVLMAVEQAWELGDLRFDLGSGDQDYKDRFANSADTVEWSVVVPPLTRPFARPALIPWYAGRHSFGRLPPRAKQRLRNALSRP
jgi:CelD/BcsL family acetyltransferase involved in cellulose biosynthesis